MVGRIPRTRRQIEEHYLVERELSDRLRDASRDKRRTLYAEVYDELFRRVPHHPQLAGPRREASRGRRSLALLGRYLRPDQTLLELGAGDCATAFEAAKRVRSVIAIEVSREILKTPRRPPNLSLAIANACQLPLPDRCIDLAYSDQFIEHLHPEDAIDQLREVARVLKPGGLYLCVTPNALSGPHDVSRYFDDNPTGFHLKEYTVGELIERFRAAGFSRMRILIGARGIYLPFSLPATRASIFERLLTRLPLETRRRLARSTIGRLALGVNLLAVRNT